MKLLKIILNLFDGSTSPDTTTSPGMSAEMKTYYDKQLLTNAEPLLIHDQFADKKPIPQGSGKTIEFRRFASLPKALTALTEAKTPKGQNMSVSAITATVKQYGGWIQSSDLLQMTTIDPVLDERTKILGSQAGRTLDTITREIANGGTNVQYAHKVSGSTKTAVYSRANLTKDCHLTRDEIFRAAAALKAKNAPTIDGKYIAIIHPYTAYDIMSSDDWIDVNKYSNATKIFNGEIGSLGGVRFVETTEAKVFLPGAIFGGGESSAVVAAEAASSTTTIKVSGVFTKASSTVSVYVNGIQNTITAVSANSSEGTTTLTLGTALAAAVPAGSVVCGTGASKSAGAVFSTLVLGAHAYATTELSGGGLQHIVKQLGYGDDPLNQRSSSGWKATKTAAILNQFYMVRIESINDYSAVISEN